MQIKGLDYKYISIAKEGKKGKDISVRQLYLKLSVLCIKQLCIISRVTNSMPDDFTFPTTDAEFGQIT